MTSVKEKKINEVVNDPITSVPATHTCETTPSKLERGPDQNLSILPDETLEGVFDIKIVDIAKDGTHRFLDGVFENQLYFDNQLTRLINATPKDELRLFIAKKAKYTSSRMEPLGWMPERTKGSEEKYYPHNNLIWGPHDPAQFRKLLRCCLENQHTAFWGRYHFWAEHRALNTHKILFKWMEASPEHLVGMILFDAEDWTTSNREAFLRWISKHQFVSAIRFGDDTLQTLGKLFLVDFMEFITSNGIAALKGEVDNTRTVEARMDNDGLPYADPPEYPIDTLSDQITALLESLKLSTSTSFRPESADSLDRIAEDLVVRLDFMKQCVKRMKDMHYVRLNNYITRSNLRES